jgi:peptidoglycan hydrolase-like protein with peptidoglycan-binding domain
LLFCAVSAHAAKIVNRLRRAVALVAVAAIAAALLAAAFQLGRRATKTLVVRPAEAAPATIVTRSGTLEETRPLQVTAQWKTDRPLYNRLAGTVTSSGLVQQSADLVAPGDVLYAIDHRDVVVMPGDEPAYRDIGDGVKGADVEQVQRFLESAGFSPGPIDGVWGPAMSAAWNSWRKAQGRPVSSTVPLGEVVFVPGLPRLIAAADGLVLGKVVTTSDQVASLLQTTPSLFVDTPKEASLALTAGMKVDVEIGSQQIAAQVSSRRSNTETGVRVELDRDATVCGDWCGAIRVGTPSTWRGVAQISPPVNGTIVPIGALRTGTGSGTSVVLGDGRTQEVKIVAKVGSEAVVEGIKPGDVLRLPGPPETAKPTTTSKP